MKQVLFILVVFSMSLSHVNAQKLKNYQDSLAYALGQSLGQEMKSMQLKDVDEKIIMRAIKETMTNKEMMIPMDESKVFLKDAKIQMKKQAGLDFLADQAKRPEVKSLEDGILYEILIPGNGPSPEVGGNVKIHYEGRLIDGTVFDSSYKRGKSIEFDLKRLIKAWQIALPDMKVGEKRTIYVPSEMGYGARGSGSIPPYSVLVFDIELLGI